MLDGILESRESQGKYLPQEGAGEFGRMGDSNRGYDEGVHL